MTILPGLGEQQPGFFEHGLDCGEKLSGGGAVEHAVVGGEGERGQGAGDEGAVGGDDRAGGDAADGQDGGLGRVDDGGEVVDAVHTQVGEGEGAALEVGEAQAASAGARAEVGELAGEFVEAVAAGVVDDGDEEALVDAGGDADVDVGPFGDVVAREGGVDAGVAGEGVGAGFDEEGGQGDFGGASAAASSGGRRSARTARARVMSASTARVNWGIARTLAVMRAAVVRRIGVRGTWRGDGRVRG